MSGEKKKYTASIAFVTASSMLLSFFSFEAGAQNKIDPAVLRSAQSYCLEKGLSIVSDEFSSCLADRIYSLSTPAPAPAPKSSATTTPMPVVVSAVVPEPTTASVQHGSDTTGMEMYPPSTLHGNKDPDINWLGGKVGKRDLNIRSIPEGLTAITVYGSGQNYRKMVCKTPCRVAIGVGLSWAVNISDGPKMYVASQVPEWRTGWVKSMHFSPDTILFKSAAGLEEKLSKAQAACEIEGKKKGTIKHTNCVAIKMGEITN